MNNFDIDTCLLLGSPVNINGFNVHPLKLKEINKIKFSEYYVKLNYLFIDTSSIQKMMNTTEDIKPWDFVIKGCMLDENFKKMYLDILKLFLKDDIKFNEYFLFHIDEFRIIDEETFCKIINIIKLQNFIEVEDKTKKESSAISEYKRKVEEMKKKYAKAIKKEENNTFLNIISSLCAKHPSINLLNVEELTIYQIINQFKRINMIDDYFISIKSLLAGASKDEVNVKAWYDNLK
jgi:hypothetical protein